MHGHTSRDEPFDRRSLPPGGLGARSQAAPDGATPTAETVTRLTRTSIIAPTMSTRGAGGTTGGVGQFFLGLAMAVAGAYPLTNPGTLFFRFWGYLRPPPVGPPPLPPPVRHRVVLFHRQNV